VAVTLIINSTTPPINLARNVDEDRIGPAIPRGIILVWGSLAGIIPVPLHRDLRIGGAYLGTNGQK
jgi:hypothetical protein